MTVATQTRRPRGYILLWIIVILSLAFNILLVTGGIFALQAYRSATRQSAAQLNAAAEQLDQNRLTNFDIPVVIDEVLPVNFTVEYSDNFQVPIDTSIPVNTSVTYSDVFEVPIEETIRIDTDFEVDVTIPLLNRVVPLVIPIKTDIPLQLDIEVPVEIEIPVETEVPVNLVVDIPIDTVIPINEEVPVQLDFGVTVPIEEETTLPSLFDQIIDSLNSGAQRLEEESNRFAEWLP